MIGTTEQLTAEEEVDKGGVLARYAELIGIDEARYPDFDEFPDQLTLPPEVIGDYIGSILATEGDGIERRQLILWRNQSFAHGKVGKGIRNASGSPTLMKDKARAFLGRKAFLFYHAHPETTAEEIKDGFAPEENKDFSIGDIGFMRLFPRMAYIFGVGKKDGGTFAFQTSESKHLPLSSVWGYVRTYIDSILKYFKYHSHMLWKHLKKQECLKRIYRKKNLGKNLNAGFVFRRELII
jgi:hypothetical protein